MIALSRPPLQQQRGAVLVISLIILLLMTIIGVSAMQGTTLQEKMAGNLRDGNIAFQAAEAALRDAENYLSATAGSLPIFSANCGSVASGNRGLCLPATPDTTPQWANATYWGNTDKSRRYGLVTNITPLPQVSKQPRYMVEEMAVPPLDPTEPPEIRYRNTAQGYGISATNQAAGPVSDPDNNVATLARAMLQTVYKP